MKKKILLAASAIAAIALGTISVAACNKNNIPAHEHTLFPIAATEATCVAEGNIAYDECLYCRKRFIDGKEKSVDDTVIAVNPNNHGHKRTVDGYEPQCSVDGRRTYDICDDCHKVYIDDELSSIENTVIKANGTHTYGDELVCSVCHDSYRLAVDGEYYDIDGSNRYDIVGTQGFDALGYASSAKSTYVEYGLEHRLEFSAQVANVNNIAVSCEDGKWIVDTKKSGNTFTRFAYGVAGTAEAYVGRFLVTYELTVSADTKANRMGMRVTNDNATVISETTQSALLGTDTANGGDGVEYNLVAGTVYSFAYVIELTDETQLVQIFNCMDGVQATTISNMHFVNLDGAMGIVGARLIYFGETDAENRLVKIENCTHSYKYDVAARSATCLIGGVIDHEHCPVCGKNYIDAVETDEPVMTDKVDHNYGELQPDIASTCAVKGHAAYYHCDWCDTYFDSNKNELEGLPEYELIEHTIGDWQSDVNGHWKECSECNQRFESAAHIPGPEATETTDQTCTECGYVLALATAHTHSMTLMNQKGATASEDGYIEHYACSSCHKTFSDEAGENEIDVVIKYSAVEIVVEDGWFADTPSKPNPDNWNVQYAGSATGKVEDGVLQLSVASNSKADKNKTFVRFIPEKDGEAFVGAYVWSFDFKVTGYSGSAAANQKLRVGYFIQHMGTDGKSSAVQINGTNVQIADVDTVFEVGTTYRFSVYVETLNADEYVQFNVRNTANCGASFEISNASISYYPSAAITGEYKLTSIAFAEPVEPSQADATPVALEAVLPDNKYN